MTVRMTKSAKKSSNTQGENGERPLEATMPFERSPNSITTVTAMSEIASGKNSKTVHGCMVESHESTRQRAESSQPKNQRDHIAGKRFTSMSHCDLVQKFIPMPQVMKNSGKKPQWTKSGKNSRQFKFGTWEKSRAKKEVILEAQRSKRKSTLLN